MIEMAALKATQIALLTFGVHKHVVRNQATQGSSEKFHVDIALVRIICYKHTSSMDCYIPVGAVDQDIVAPSYLQDMDMKYRCYTNTF